MRFKILIRRFFSVEVKLTQNRGPGTERRRRWSSSNDRRCNLIHYGWSSPSLSHPRSFPLSITPSLPLHLPLSPSPSFPSSSTLSQFYLPLYLVSMLSNESRKLVILLLDKNPVPLLFGPSADCQTNDFLIRVQVKATIEAVLKQTLVASLNFL